ncbi:lanthionine synthetase LanC family protein [Streptomyces sp. NPDC101160]|uniref:class III lanthionine synthetase LanKC N-terminal domain-containing protein n=1 Tax=Streptomyces sp. NPDC101160 TaxID=3366118 RepID=UPI003811F511
MTYPRRARAERPADLALLPDLVRAALARRAAGGPGACSGEWSIDQGEFWCHVVPAGAVRRPQGWKLHVSATPLSAPLVLARCAEVLIDHGTAFKFAGSPARVAALVSGRSARGGGGKFLTVYPADDDRFRQLAEELHRVTVGLPGPAVLSDRRYRPDSQVSYRYGVFAGVRELTSDGGFAARLTDPDGRPVADQRNAWYSPPAWAGDPFPDRAPAPARSTGTAKPVLLAGRYVVRGAIQHSNKGGVYRAEDTRTGAPVVVKQARPHVGAGLEGLDVRDLLRREAALLGRLGAAAPDLVPPLVEVFEQQGSVFLATGSVPGTTLRRAVADRLAGDGAACPDGRTAASLVWQLIELVATAHGLGVTLHDFGPNNVMVTPDGRLLLIDLEMAAREGERWILGATPGYTAPELRDLDQVAPALPPSVDLYALGATILHALSGADPLFAPDLPAPQARPDEERLAALVELLARDLPLVRRFAPLVRGLMRDEAQQRWDLQTARDFVRGLGEREATPEPWRAAAPTARTEPRTAPSSEPGRSAGAVPRTTSDSASGADPGTSPAASLAAAPAAPAGSAVRTAPSSEPGRPAGAVPRTTSDSASGADPGTSPAASLAIPSAASAGSAVRTAPSSPPGRSAGAVPRTAAGPASRTALGSASAAASGRPDRTAARTAPRVPEDTALTPGPADLRDRLLRDGIAHLLATMRPDDPERLWSSDSFGETCDPVALQHGSAGPVAVLARALRHADELGIEAEPLREGLRTAARWTVGRQQDIPGNLPGLHFGRAGTAWAMLDAAQALDDAELADRATESALALPVCWPNPDVCHGAAGSGLTQVRFWRATGDRRFLDRVGEAAAGLLKAGRHTPEGLFWPVPEDFDSALAGAWHYGFAHGVAGVGTFLLYAAEATGEDAFRTAAAEAGATLAAAARSGAAGTLWPVDRARHLSDSPELARHWCSGSSGVGTFLVRLWQAGGGSDPALRELVEGAARAVLAGRATDSPATCHGLSGNAEFLLDTAELTGGDGRRAGAELTGDEGPRAGAALTGAPGRRAAAELTGAQGRRTAAELTGDGGHRAGAELLVEQLAAHAVLRDGRLLVPDENRRTVLAEYATGLAGSLSMLLRLRCGGPRAWLPEG